MNKQVIHIFHKPLGLGDQFSAEIEEELNRLGLKVKIRWLWWPWLYHLLCKKSYSGKFRLHVLHDLLLTFRHVAFLLKIRTGDVVIVDGDSTVRPGGSCLFERLILKKGANYILYLVDDLFSLPVYRESSLKRLEMASALIVVTPQLRAKVMEEFPNMPVALLEEPIDLERVGEVKYPQAGGRVGVAWTGRMPRARKMVDLIAQAKVCQDFDFRVVTGKRRPDMDFPFDWDWFPFSHKRESSSFNGCVAGIANLEDTPYDACKGNYKVKTYMAMGLCPIVSNVGYARDLIDHGKTGLLVSSEEEWLEAIAFVVSNPDAAADIGKRARRFVEREFSATPLAEVWHKELCRIVQVR